MKKKPMTVGQAIAAFNADPELVALRAKAKVEQERREAASREAERPVVDALRAAGIEVGSVWDLVNTRDPYPNAIPVLLEHLVLAYPGGTREGIARALAVPEARNAVDLFLRLYRQEGDKRAKSGLAVAIANNAKDRIEDVIALVSDPSHGSSRLLLVNSLGRSHDPRARAALMKLGADPDLHKEVEITLKKMNKRKRK